MPRKGPVPKRPILPDPKFGIESACALHQQGDAAREEVGRRADHVRMRFEVIATRTGRDPMDIFTQALGNAMPLVEVRPRRVGGATYQVPMEVRPDRRQAMAMRWLISYARLRPGKSMTEKLANELMDAANNQGQSIKKREDTHKNGGSQQGLRPLRW